MKMLRRIPNLLTVYLTLFAGCSTNHWSGADDGMRKGPHEFYFPTTGVTVQKQAILLSIDDFLLPLKENVSTYMSTPTYRKEPVLTPGTDNPMAPDQVATSFYGTVLHENGKFRMWYYALRLKEPGDAIRSDPANLLQGPVCYAESSDGIQWTKPSLGQVEIRGSKDNNAILLPDDLIEGVHLIKDEEDPDPQRRYKMVYNPNNGKTWVIRTATSPDGIHWKAAADYGIDQFLETSSFMRFNGLYIVNGQTLDPSDGGFAGGRQGKAILSEDFEKWLPGTADAFLLPEPANPAQRGGFGPYDQVHLGVGAASFGNVAVGLYGIWHNQPGDFDSKKRWEWFGYAKTSADLGLVISDDGLHFREPVKGRVFMSRLDAPATPIGETNYPTVLCQSGNGILNVGDQTLIYFSRWRNAAYRSGFYVEVARATLPRDRWAGLGLYDKKSTPDAYQDHGSVWSAPVRLPASGCRVVLNVDHASLMTVEVSDAKFHLLPNYSGARSGRSQSEGGLDCSVSWPAGDLSALAGHTVRFKMNLKDENGVSPRLYAVYLKSE
jgi:hypothetical protein